MTPDDYSSSYTHEANYCIICNPKSINEYNTRLSKLEFDWHMKSSASSNGQSLNREMLIDMFKSYMRHIQSLQQQGKNEQWPRFVFIPVMKPERARMN